MSIAVVLTLANLPQQRNITFCGHRSQKVTTLPTLVLAVTWMVIAAYGCGCTGSGWNMFTAEYLYHNSLRFSKRLNIECMCIILGVNIYMLEGSLCVENHLFIPRWNAIHDTLLVRTSLQKSILCISVFRGTRCGSSYTGEECIQGDRIVLSDGLSSSQNFGSPLSVGVA